MPTKTSSTGSELFIVDNSDDDWKVLRYLHDWCQISKAIDIATGYFEIGSLLAMKDEWQKVDKIRILMGDEVSNRTRDAFARALSKVIARLDGSIEAEKEKNDFLNGLPAIVDALKSGKIECRVYRKDKFHAKAYITHARLDVVGSSALVGSSNFTYPGLTENIELNVQITGRPVSVLQEWYETHWDASDDISAEILRVMERHVREYSPFEVYARSLFELFLDAAPGERKWEEQQSRMFKVLDGYQQEGYRNLVTIARDYGGALLCDGVGLGKTFVGLMMIERLIVNDRKKVVLLAPKGAIESVWKPALRQYLSRLTAGAFGTDLFLVSHTDLGLPRMRALFEDARNRAHAIIIDEAHHFRNPGAAGTGAVFLEAPRKAQEGRLFREARRSRYRELFDLVPSPDRSLKQVFMLTATPINNSFHDLRHMIEIFTQKKEDYFAKRLGIHSLTAHFKRMETRLDGSPGHQGELFTDDQEAKRIISADPLVSALVVQRGRAFVKKKQQKAGIPVTAFPPREPPHRVDYSLQKVYGRLLGILERAFAKDTPLFTLPMYYPLANYIGPRTDVDPGEENRQEAVVALIRTAFLKRFESSVEAFRNSCDRLLVKLLGWATANAQEGAEKQKMLEWRQRNVKLVEAIKTRHPQFFRDADESSDDEADDDLVENEFTQEYEHLAGDEYNLEKMLDETRGDLDQLVEFYAELDKFDHRNDDKLKKLLKILREDPALSNGKVLIFTEFADTADYLMERLQAAKIDRVERIDSRTSGRDRLTVIRRFSPYYNESSSAQLKDEGLEEIRILISTDVLSEGLNLQDASRLINYDLHWNPVRLMQRIGRVDRRRKPDIESRLAEDHPEQTLTRGAVAFYNFLPPGELNQLLTLYNKVTRKTLRISKALGIEGKKLLKEDDDFADLQQFNESYEGKISAMEELELERDGLFNNDPALIAQLAQFPLRIFSGKSHPSPGCKAVFFCYRMPVFQDDGWTTEGGPCKWLLAPLTDGPILDEPSVIADAIRSIPLTPRVVTMDQPTLAGVRKKIEAHLKNTYMKSLTVPLDKKPVLKAWMELN